MTRLAKAPSALTHRRSGIAAVLAMACVLSLVLATGASATKYVDSFFGNPTGINPAGELADGGLLGAGVGGVAVKDSTGAVYVVDRGNHRIQQFDASNAFVRAWGAGVVTGGATGTGTVTNGSTSITAVATTSKFFLVGQVIAGNGIAPGTTITAVGSGTITLSQAAGPAATGPGTAISTPTGAGNVAANEKQTVTLAAGVTGGNFKLAYTTPNPSPTTAAANTTANIPFNASPAEVQTALENLANIEVGDVAVTSSNPGGAAAPGGPFTVEFTGRYGDADVAQMTVAAGSPALTGGSATVATIAIGATAPEACTVAAECKVGVTTGGTGIVSGGTFSTPQGIAVSQSTGDLYVTDGADFRVQQFSSSGAFIRAWGKDVVSTGKANDVSATAFEVCDTIAGNVAADCKIGVSTGGEGGTFGSTFAGYPSVVPAGAPNAGNVLVADPQNRRVQEFTASGAFVRAFGFDVVKVGGVGNDTVAPVNEFEVCTVVADCQQGAAGNAVGQFGSAEPKRVAADGTGAIYTTENTANFRAQKFSAAGLGAAVFGAADLGGLLGSNAPSDIVFDSASGRVLVAKGYIPTSLPDQPFFATCASPTPEVHILELNTAGVRKDTDLTCAGIGAGTSTPAVGLAVRPSTGRLYYSSTVTQGSNINRVYALDADGITPGIGTVNPATNVTSAAADLSATVNPNSIDNSFAPTLWKLQYSRNGVDWSNASTGSIGIANTTAVNVTGSAAGLLPNTLYRTRVITQKPFANPEVSSAELTFLTDAVKPEVRTTATQAVGETTATIAARINPHSTPTIYRFEWGQGAFTDLIPVPSASLGSGPDFVYVTQQLTGLQPNTTYQYRAVAISASEGTTNGPTRTFTTSSVTTGSSDRAFELVSPPDKVGGQGLSVWYNGYWAHNAVGDPAYDGSRFASETTYGGVLVDGGFSGGGDWALGERTPLGWVNRPAINRAGGQGDPELFRIPAIAAHSDDFSLTAWGTNNKGLRIFPEQEDVWGDQLAEGEALRDWESGKWEIIAPLLPEQDSTEAETQAIAGTLVAADGGHAVTWGNLRGVGGVGDPTHPNWPDLICEFGPPLNKCNDSIYFDDVSAGLSDTYPGDGIRSLVNVCTGAGADRTAIPSIDGSSDIEAAACPPPAGPDQRLISRRGASIGRTDYTSISADGARVFFVSPDDKNSADCTGTGPAGTACPPQLFVRQRQPNGEAVTRWISHSRSVAAGEGAYGGSMIGGQDSSLMKPSVFERATRDGDKVYFRTTSPLTPDDPNGGALVPGGVISGPASSLSSDLYMYDFPDAPGADPGDGTLTRISAGPSGTGDGNVSTIPPGGSAGAGLRFAASDNVARLYFVTSAPLPDVPAPGSGTITSPGGTASESSAKNLYFYDATRPIAERWRFITKLPVTSVLGGCAASNPGKGEGLSLQVQISTAIQVDRRGNCVRGTSDGSFIRIFTDGRLTADDPNTTSGDIYAYDAERDELTRISALQGGSGGSYECIEIGTGTGAQCNADPALRLSSGSTVLAVATDPLTAGDRIAFFQSRGRLVPEDRNDVYDVYQWRNGELSLISTGAPDADHTLFQGNDRTGTNVYLSTRDRLTWQDHDAVLDVYVARAGSAGFPEPTAPPACEILAGACQGGLAAPPGAPPPAGTTTTAATGNVKEGPTKSTTRQCGKGKVRKNGKCVKKRQSKPVKRTANETRRASR